MARCMTSQTSLKSTLVATTSSSHPQVGAGAPTAEQVQLAWPVGVHVSSALPNSAAAARFSGKDATQDFEEIGHSNSARELLEKYLIGAYAVSARQNQPGRGGQLGALGRPAPLIGAQAGWQAATAPAARWRPPTASRSSSAAGSWVAGRHVRVCTGLVGFKAGRGTAAGGCGTAAGRPAPDSRTFATAACCRALTAGRRLCTHQQRRGRGSCRQGRLRQGTQPAAAAAAHRRGGAGQPVPQQQQEAVSVTR